MCAVIFTQSARAELMEAQDWYENEAPGLGRLFREAVNAAILRMSLNPRQFPVVYKNIRRAMLRRFPYALERFQDRCALSIFNARSPLLGVGSTRVYALGYSKPETAIRLANSRLRVKVLAIRTQLLGRC